MSGQDDAAGDPAGFGAMSGHDPRLSAADNYRRFAREAGERSPTYRDLALAVADDRDVLAFLEELPVEKRQPNLLFGAARFLLDNAGSPASGGRVPGGPVSDGKVSRSTALDHAALDHATLRELVHRRRGELAEVVRSHRTQTNEPARCAVLLPALAGIPEPLALLEVGASAGLTLLVDRYSYDYVTDDGAHHRVAGTDPEAPTLTCRVSGPAPLPDRVPEVVWRAGLDLHPLEATDPDDARWLESLIWPGEGDRSERLRAALATAARRPPALHRGDLVDDLARVAAGAPPDATLVVLHTAVLAYVDEAHRRAFAAAVDALGARWVSVEAPGVVPAPGSAPGDAMGMEVVRDGREVLAVAEGHGAWVRWAG